MKMRTLTPKEMNRLARRILRWKLELPLKELEMRALSSWLYQLDLGLRGRKSEFSLLFMDVPSTLAQRDVAQKMKEVRRSAVAEDFSLVGIWAICMVISECIDVAMEERWTQQLFAHFSEHYRLLAQNLPKFKTYLEASMDKF